MVAETVFPLRYLKLRFNKNPFIYQSNLVVSEGKVVQDSQVVVLQLLDTQCLSNELLRCAQLRCLPRRFVRNVG